ncbi:MAG: hypothetical protein AB9880_02440 [Christensenellales bacterium]
MPKPVQTTKKTINGKAVAAVTLVVLLALTIVFTTLGFTGMKLDKEGLYKLLAWLPTPSASSDWRQALVPGADLGETFQQVYTAASPEEGKEVTAGQLEETVRLLSRRLSAGGWPSGVVTLSEGKIQMNLPQDGTHDHAYEMLAQRGDVSFATPDGTSFLTSDNITSATYHLNMQDETYAISFTLDAQGKTLFAEKTAELIGQSMSLMVDGTAIASPGINQALTEGAASLPGFSEENARAYAAMMQSGPLPLTLSLESSATGAPILGANVQRVLIIALAVAVLLIMIFFVLRFRLGGLVAVWLMVIQLTGIYFLSAVIRAGFTVSTLLAIYLSFGLLVYALLSLQNSMSTDMGHGRGARQALKDAYQGSGKLVYDVLGALLLLAIVLIILDTGAIGSFMRVLALGLLLDLALIAAGLRVMLNSIINLFGTRVALYAQGRSTKEAA